MAVFLDYINTAEIIIQNEKKISSLMLKTIFVRTGPNLATLITPTELHI